VLVTPRKQSIAPILGILGKSRLRNISETQEEMFGAFGRQRENQE
jgi:hypothetical protein